MGAIRIAGQGRVGETLVREAALYYPRPEVQEVVQQRKQLPSCRISMLTRVFSGRCPWEVGGR